MNINEFISNIRHSCLWKKKVAIFKDKSNNLQFVVVKESISKSFIIKVYNENCELTASVEITCLNTTTSNKFYICNLYVEKDYRRLNIATHMSELIDFLLSSIQEPYIIGVFEPFEFDSNQKPETSNEEVVESARNYYLKNGFELVTYETLSINEEQYPELDRIDFRKAKTGIMIYKKIKTQELQYAQIGELIIHDNALNDLDKIHKILNPKMLKLN